MNIYNKLEVNFGRFEGGIAAFEEYCTSSNYTPTESKTTCMKRIDTATIYIFYDDFDKKLSLSCYSSDKLSYIDNPPFDLEKIWNEITKCHSDRSMKEVCLCTPINIKNKLEQMPQWKRMLPDTNWTLYTDDGLMNCTRTIFRSFDSKEFYRMYDMKPCKVEDFLDRLRSNGLL